MVLSIERVDQRKAVGSRIREWRLRRDLSQAEVAKRLNISQMHVSRLQHRALQNLRRILIENEQV